MRWNRNVGMVVGLAVAFVAGMAVAAAAAKVHAKTREDVLAAMHGEAFAHAKYLLYAKQARERGDTQLADLYEKTAAVERLEHFMEEAELIGFGGTDQENLTDAIKGEDFETTKMYPGYAKMADAAGDKAVAEKLREIGKDEAKHRDAYQAELKRLEKQPQKPSGTPE